jgi:cutinase
MLTTRLRGLLCAVPALAAMTLSGAAPAAADPCPDIEVIFARGTAAEPGPGKAGNAFVEALRPKVGGRSIGVYGVNYPASFDFAASAPLGAADATARVQWMADNCPATKIVLGGLSQGAGVISLITANPGPLGKYTAAPMPPLLADHVAAVAVFGNPVRKFPGGGPLNEISGIYGAKTIDLCAPNDIFCSRGLNLAAHFSYEENGMINQAAEFAAARLQ